MIKDRNLRNPQKETTKAAPHKILWHSLDPTDEQQENFKKAIFRWIIDNGMQKAPLHRSTKQAIMILPYLAQLSPEWKDVDDKTFSRKDCHQHMAFWRVIDKYGKKMPPQELLDAEWKEWQQQQATQEKLETESELESQIVSEKGKGEQASCQEKAANTTPQTKMYHPPKGMYATDTP